MPKDKLADRQLEILTAIEDYIDQNGYSPSFRDIGKIVNLASSSTIQRYMDRLKVNGDVTWVSGQPRTLKVLKK